MNLSRPTAAVVLIAGLAPAPVIIAYFVNVEWALNTLGVIPLIVASVVELICAPIAMRNDILGTLRGE